MTTPDALSVTLERFSQEDKALEGEPRSWLRYALLSQAAEEALVRAHELTAMAVMEEPDALQGNDTKPREERAEFWRGMALAARKGADVYQKMAAEERATRGAL